MENELDREVPGGELRRWRRLPVGDPRRRVLVGVRDPTLRVEVSAQLVLGGCHVLLARTGDQTAALARAVDVVVADARLLAGLGRATHALLRRVVTIAICDPDVPTPAAARARFTPPFAVAELALAVRMLARW
jgi:hypothetical protein